MQKVIYAAAIIALTTAVQLRDVEDEAWTANMPSDMADLNAEKGKLQNSD